MARKQYLDSLDAALAFGSAIGAHLRRVSDMSFARSELAGGFNPDGVFKVVQPFDDALVAHQFSVGEYVSSAVVPPPMLLRLYRVKRVLLVEG